jgi:hypothetical protein
MQYGIIFSEWETLAGFCEDDNELLGYIKCGQFF